MTSFSCTGLVNPQTGALDSLYVNVPPTSNSSYLFDSQYLPTSTDFSAVAYWPDVSKTAIVQNWNTAYPSLKWEQPFYAYGMNHPVIYEVVEAPAGMIMADGEMLRNQTTGFFDYKPAVLTWETPTAGSHKIAVRATDQLGRMVQWVFLLRVQESRNYFMALNATGDGSGSSPSNYASYANTFLGQATLSPCKGKVLRIKGDTYPNRTQLSTDSNFTAVSWIAMPNENPVFSQRFTLIGDNFNFHGIEWNGVAVSSNGVITNNTGSEGFGFFNCRFNACSNSAAGVSDNQSCIALMRAGKDTGRNRIFVSSCQFINCNDLHGFDYFKVADHAFVNNTLTINNGVTTLTKSWIFNKLDVFTSEMLYNRAIVPLVSGGTVGVAQLYNANYDGNTIDYDQNHRFEYNHISASGGQNLQLNFSATPTQNPVTIDNIIKRNTLIGGTVSVNHWIDDGNPDRRNYLENNVILNPSGGAPSPANSSTWFVKDGNIESTNTALVDSDGYIISGTDKGKKGHGIWRPE